MPSRIAAAILATLILGLPGAARAQNTAPSAGAGGTATAPNVSAVGRVKPPGRAESPTGAKPSKSKTAADRRDDAISTGICIGCNAK